MKKFVSYLTPLSDMAESVLQDVFMNGLEPAMQAKVASRHLVGLDVCMREAQCMTDCNVALKLMKKEGSALETKKKKK